MGCREVLTCQLVVLHVKAGEKIWIWKSYPVQTTYRLSRTRLRRKYDSTRQDFYGLYPDNVTFIPLSMTQQPLSQVIVFKSSSAFTRQRENVLLGVDLVSVIRF